MLRTGLLGVLALGVAGCTGFDGTPRPAEVSLTQDRLVVTLTDASRCEMARPEGVVWSGRLEGCALDWPYDVELDARSNILRQIVEAIFTPANGLVTLNALGTVTVTDPVGGTEYVFVSPPPIEED